MPKISRLVKLLLFSLSLFFVVFYFSWPRDVGWKAKLNSKARYWQALTATRLQPRYYQCLEKAKSIKIGMTRKQLEDLAFPDGGIAYRYEDRYILKGCFFPMGYVKIHINFESADEKRNLFFAQEDDIVTQVSEPFWGYPAAD